MAQYSLDVDLDQLVAAKTQLSTLSTHLTTHSTQCANEPDLIGSSWSGAAATAIKTEMTGLGTETAVFAPKFADAASAIGRFIGRINSAQQDVDDLNKKWAQANTDCTTAIRKAQATHDQTVGGLASGDKAGRTSADDTLGSAKGMAATSLRYTLQGLDYQFQLTRQGLQGAAQQLGSDLRAATVVPVPDKTIAAYANGSLPPALLAALARSATDTLGGTLHLPEDQQSSNDGTAAAKKFNDFAQTGPHSKAEVQAFLASLNIDSAAFRQSFLAGLDLKAFDFLQLSAHTGMSASDAKDYGLVVTAISQMMAKGSNAATQGVYPVPSSFYDDWRNSYPTKPNADAAKVLIAEVVQAGEGNGATWDSGLLTSISKDLVAYERQQLKNDPYFTWTGTLFPGQLTTQAELDMFGNNIGIIDPMSMVFDAMRHDPVAAQDTLLGSNGSVDTDLLHYLYSGRAGAGSYAWADSLGGTLNAATTFVGTGGPGSRDYNSAAIVGDLVHYFGTHPDKLPIGMEQSIVDILCHHIQDVDAADPTALAKVGLVTVGDPTALLARDRLTTAVINNEDLQGLLSRVFQLDYYADKGRPLYQQLSATQVAAFHQDFLDLAHAGSAAPAGAFQSMAGRQGRDSTLLITSLTSALRSQGASEDAANAAARNAADWVFGLATDKIPVGDAGGPAGVVAGLGVDAVKNWALDQFFPTTDKADEAAAEGADINKSNRLQGALMYLNWADEAGILPPDASAATWAAQHPNESHFIVPGPDGRPTIGDITSLYQHRLDDPAAGAAWNDFVTYWKESGDPYLQKTDLYDAFELGTLSP